MAVAFVCVTAIAALLFELGKNVIHPDEPFLKSFDLTILILLFLDLVFRFFIRLKPLQYLRENIFPLIIFIGYLILAGWIPVKPVSILTTTFAAESVIRVLLVVRLALLAVKLLTTLAAVREFFANMSSNPAKSIMTGFAIVIFAGAVFLSLPVSLQNGKTLSFLDALFTSTSAVCVTGLIVVDTGTHFSMFGQLVILLLIQIGGLGIMTLAVFIGLFLKERLSIRERQTTRSILELTSATSVYDLIKKIVLITLIVECIGTIFIYISHVNLPPPPGGGREAGALFYSIFHSVSAFCNAGFSLNQNSLVHLSGDLLGNITFMFLIISGGLGFTVILNLKNRLVRGRRERFTLHSRIVLVMTGILLLTGALFFFLAESGGSLRGKPPGEQVLASFFQSTTTRTAGFNTVDMTALRPATLVFFLALMLIGASPGGTGGGIKTTTFTVMLLTISSLLKEKTDVEARRRVISRDIVNKALAITTLFVGLIFVASLVITLADPALSYLHVLFEVISASATVGLSAGITGSLSDVSKSVIIVTMFLGRIGPLTLVMAMTLRRTRRNIIRYPEEKIMVG